MITAIIAVMTMTAISLCAFASSTGDVAGAIEGTWGTASSQIKQVVNNVVFAASTRPPYNKNWYMENGEIKSNGQPVPIEEIWEIIDDLENLNLSNTWEIEEVSAEDLNVFPNLKTVYIDSGNLKDFEVNNPNITELTVKSQSLRTVKINGCHELETFIIGPCQQNLHEIVVDNNHKLKSFELLEIGPGDGTTGVIQVRNNPNLIKFSTTGNQNLTIALENLDLFEKFDLLQSQRSGYFNYHIDFQKCPKFDKKNCTIDNNATEI